MNPYLSKAQVYRVAPLLPRGWRAPKGLLGGMLGLPGGSWAESVRESRPPIAANWRQVPGEVRHTFTHFHLRLKVLISQCDDCAVDPPLVFTKPEPSNLPTVFRKALIHGLSGFSDHQEQG